MAGIYLISLGCDKNRIDAEMMSRLLTDGGHVVVGEPSLADCAVVNTCGFVESAKEEAISSIFDMAREKERGSIRAVIVTGCLAQRYGEELQRRIPEVDVVLGLARNADICEAVARALGGERYGAFGDPEAMRVTGERALSTPGHYAYLRIAEGCGNRCTFCAIPSIRGRYRSRPMADIVSEAEALAASGARELILIAQDTTYYGRDLGGDGLPELLRELCGIDGLWKLRLLYAYPERVDDKLIEAMAASPRVARYIDIPMQHSDAAILRRMGRPGSGEKLLALLGRLRAAMPDITVRSSFIVGFPGETETQFKGLLDFLDEARLGRAGCFAFSPEEGTPAAKLPGRISAGVKRKRAERFMQRQDAVMARSLESMARRKMEVICDGFDEGAGMFACRGEADAPEIDTCVYLPPESGLVPGEIYSVSITGTNGADLYAELA